MTILGYIPLLVEKFWATYDPVKLQVRCSLHPQILIFFLILINHLDVSAG